MINTVNLPPFKKMCITIGNLPSSFMESMTYYECLCWLYEYFEKTLLPAINTNSEAITELQNAFTTLKNYIDNYFENLDVQEEINNKLDEMASDGTLESIIDEYTIGKDVFRTRLYLTRLGRFNLTTLAENGYSNMQAGCYIGDNYYIFPVIKNNDDGDARLYKINLATGSILTYNDVSGVHHANGCCLKGTSLFFSQTFDNEQTPLYGIVEVDVSTLNVIETHTVDFRSAESFQINSIGYDTTNDKFYLIGTDKFAVANTDFEVESVENFVYPHKTYRFNQGGCFYDKYVCVVVNSENAILCFNTDGTLHHVIDIGEIQANNVFGEIENITVYNDEIYLNANLSHSTLSNLFLVQFFKASLKGGGYPNKYSSNTVFNTAVINELVVDKTTYDNLTDYNKFTCNGTTEKPFETIAEAISYITNDHLYNIKVNDTNTYPENLTIVNKNLLIKANGSVLGTIKIVGSKVTLTNTYIGTSELRTPVIATPDDYNTPLFITANSEVSLFGICGYHSDNCIAAGMIYPLVIEASVLYDASTASGDYKKFLDVNSTYTPLIIGSNVVTGKVGAITSPKMNFVDYRPSQSLITGNSNIDFSTLPQFTNTYRGVWVAVTTEIGNSDYVRLSQLHANEMCIIEDITGGTTKRYGFRFNLRPSQSQIQISSYSYDFDNHVWEADTDIKYFVKYMFEI